MTNLRQAVGEAPKAAHVCPWWLGYVLASPLRRLLENPERLLAPWIRPGMTVLDFGPGMGFHTLPAARLVGPAGHVIAVDLQPRMLASLRRRAERHGLDAILETRVSLGDDFGLEGLDGRVDVAYAFNVIHETGRPELVIRALAATLAPGGTLLIVEPRGHVSADAMERTFRLPIEAGLEPRGDLRAPRGTGAAFGRSSG